MKTTVEDRIVQLRFDNDQFEKGAEQSLRTLDKLEGVLDTLGQGGLDKLGSALDTIQYRFSTLGMMGAAAIENITSSVMRLASSLLAAIPNQIISGGKTRALNIEQARFQLKGLGVAWDDVADDIDHAVKGTAYGLDEAAIVASQLAASGVGYKNIEGEISDMGKILRGISGVAAMTNSSYGEIGHIFTGIAGTGHVMTQDLRMLEGRGLNVAAKLAQVLNETSNSARYTEESIREMVSKGQVDFLTFARAMDYAFGEHATAANETYTGSLSNMKAALSRIGADFATPTFTALRDIQNSLRVTFDSVRKITKPFAEGAYTNWLNETVPKVINLINKVSEGIVHVKALGESIYNSLFNPIRKIRELGENGGIVEVIVENDDVTRRLKNIRDFLDGIKVIFLNIKDVIDTAKISFKHFMEDFGFKGFTSGFDGILEALGNFGRKMQEIGRIFQWVKKNSDFGFSKDKGWVYSIRRGGFIADDAKARFLALRQVFYDVFYTLSKVGSSAFRILKAGFDIVGTVVKDLAGVIKVIFPSLGKFSDVFHTISGFVVVAAEKLALFVERVRDLVQSHQILTSIATVLSTVATSIQDALHWVHEFVREIFGLEEGETIFSNFSEKLSKFGTFIHDTFGTIKESILGSLGDGNSDVGSVLTTFVGGILTAIMAYRKYEKTKWAIDRSKRTWDFLHGIFDKAHDLANIPDKIATVLSRTSGALRAFSDNLDAKTIKEIGKAVLFLAAGMWIMASVDADRMIVALAGVATVLLLLIGAMGVLITFMDRGSSTVKKVTTVISGEASKWTKFKNGVKDLGGTIKNFFKGLTVGINRLLNAGSILALSASLVALAGAVVILAVAAKIFATMSWGELAKGLIAIVVTLGLLVGALILISKFAGMGAMVGMTISLVALGAAIAILTASLLLLSQIDFDKLVKSLLILVLGIAAMVSALLVLAAFGTVGGTGMIVAATAMLILAAAIAVLTVALLALSLIPWDVLLTDIVLLTLGLLAFGAVLMVMSLVGPGTVLAAAALLILSAAIIALGAALIVISQFDLERIAKAAKILVLAFIGLAAALIVLSLVGPGALVAAAALFVVGLAFLALGAGVALGAIGLSALAIALQLMPPGDKIKDIAGALGKLGRNMIWLGAGGAFSSLGVKAFEGLVPLATGLAMMENLNFDKLGPGLKAIGKGLTSLGLGGLLMAIGGALGAGSTVAMLSALGKALPDLAKGYESFNGMGAETLEKTGVALGKGIGALFKLQFSTFRDGVPVLLELAKALPELARGFSSFSTMDEESIASTGYCLYVGISALFSLQFSTFRDGVPVLVELANALPGLANGFSAFSGIDPEWIANTGTSLSTGVGALFKLQFATFRDGVPVLVELSNALPGLAAGFSSFNGMDPETIANTGYSLYVGVNALFGLQFSTFKDGVPVLIELSNALPGLAAGFGTFSTSDPEMIANTGIALGKAIGALFKLQFSSLIDGTQTLTNLGTALPILAQGFKAFEGLDPEWIRNTATALSDGINALTGNIFSDLFKGSPDFMGMANGIMQIAIAVSSIPADGGERMISIGNGLTSLLTTSTDTLNGISITLLTIYNTVVLYATITILAIQTESDTILQILALLELGMNIIVQRTSDSILNILRNFGMASTTLVMQITSSIVGMLRRFQMEVVAVLNGLIQSLANVANEAYNQGVSIGANLADGLWSQVAAVQEAANALYAAAAAAESASRLYDSISSRTSSRKRFGANGFGYTGSGINYAAMYSKAGESAGSSFGNGVAKGAQSSLGVHSPSRVMERIGKFTALGFALGLSDGGADVANNFANIMNPLFAALSDIMSQDFDLSPTISPVVDMSNAEEMSSLLSSMFGGVGSYAINAANHVANAELNNDGRLGTQGTTNNSMANTINIYTQPGQDANEIAKMVEQRLVKLNKQQRLGALA